MEIKHDLSQTEVWDTGGSYQVIAWYHGHELIYFQEFGSYQGEWLMVSFDPISKEYYVWRGSFGSCSGCDAFEAELGWSDNGYNRERVADFCDDYDPFLVVPSGTMSNVVQGGPSRIKEIIPANMREPYEYSLDDLIDLIYLSCKLHGGFDVTPQDILNARNVELRQMGLRNYGYEKFIADSEAVVLDRWRYDQLLQIGSLRLLRLCDSSTAKVYLLPVPDRIERVKEGLAWSFNLSEDNYNPLIET